MNILIVILQFFEGKKAALAAICGALITYFAAKGMLGDAELVLYNTLNLIIWGGGSYATGKMLYGK